MRFRIVGLILVAAASLSLQAVAPSCNKCSATYVPASEINAYLKRAEEGSAKNIRLRDQACRTVDAGKMNVGVGVVYRMKLTAPAPQSAAEHHLVSEVYHVIDGEATLVTGSDIDGLEERPADDRAVKMLNGPGGNGSSIRNGVTHQLKAGDVIVIPAGVGHMFTRIDDHIRYLVIRLDPDKVVPLKSADQSQADLQSAGK